MNHYHTSLAHLKYGSIIDLLNRRFWWPTMKKDLKDYIARCPECQLDQSASGVHSPLPIRPVPQSHFHLNVGELTFMAPWSRPNLGTSTHHLYRLCNSMGLGQAGQRHDRICRFRFSV
ncbi:hypothetical protein BASA83_010124 [Batrachochytrium salamandrivorans]|nr:hypothetical protein BASA83_010124 [Batrachochytrium salamandrivorans]